MKTLKTLALGLSLAASSAAGPEAFAVTTTIQPDEAASQDTWVYSFAPAPRGDGEYLGVSAVTIQAGPSTQTHNTATLLRFDLPAVASADVTGASIQLFTRTIAPAQDPTAGTPIAVSLYAATESWAESATVAPAIAATPATVVSVNAIGAWFTFDVTDLVKAWLDAPASNFGVVLKAEQESFVGATFHSANNTVSAALAPKLVIDAVPEPASALLLGLPLLALARRRRKA